MLAAGMSEAQIALIVKQTEVEIRSTAPRGVSDRQASVRQAGRRWLTARVKWQ